MPAYVLSDGLVVARMSNGAPRIDDTAANHLADRTLDRKRFARQRTLVQDRRIGLDHPVDRARPRRASPTTDLPLARRRVRLRDKPVGIAVHDLRGTLDQRRSSRRALPAARRSSTRPLASITVITAPAKYSPITRVPTSASNAIRSTPSLR